jgi:hypothetical protein
MCTSHRLHNLESCWYAFVMRGTSAEKHWTEVECALANQKGKCFSSHVFEGKSKISKYH